MNVGFIFNSGTISILLFLILKFIIVLQTIWSFFVCFRVMGDWNSSTSDKLDDTNETWTFKYEFNLLVIESLKLYLNFQLSSPAWGAILVQEVVFDPLLVLEVWTLVLSLLLERPSCGSWAIEIALHLINLKVMMDLNRISSLYLPY